MPALEPTDHVARIEWLGLVPHRNEPVVEGVPCKRLDLRFDGVEGCVHGGLTRPSCSRVLGQYPRGTEIRNTRQLSIISAEELALIAAELGLEAVDPAHLGATIVVSGIVDLTHLPPGSRLQAESGATITVDMENQPCQFPAMTIERAAPGHGKAFKAAAKGRRGLVGWVEREGPVALGDRLRLHLPTQRPWRGDFAGGQGG